MRDWTWAGRRLSAARRCASSSSTPARAASSTRSSTRGDATRSSLAARSAGSPARAPAATPRRCARRSPSAGGDGRGGRPPRRARRRALRRPGARSTRARARRSPRSPPLAPLHTRAALEGIDAAARGAARPAAGRLLRHRLSPHAAARRPRRTRCRATGASASALRRYGFHGLNVAWCHEQARAGSSARSAAGGSSSAISAAAARSARCSTGARSTRRWASRRWRACRWRRARARSTRGCCCTCSRSGIEREELDEALNHRSGLLGICRPRRAARGRARGVGAATSARSSRFDVLVRGVSGAVAAMTTSLRGLDALVFSGRRRRALGAAARRDLRAPRPARRRARRRAQRASTPSRSPPRGAPVAVLVVPAGEEIVIARQTARLLDAGRSIDNGEPL